MTARERFFLVMAVVGFVVPNVMVAAFIADNGVDIGHYLGDWVETLPAAQLGVDLLIAALAFLAWSAWEGKRIGEPRWWWTIPATFLVGLCFGIPLFLYLRERRLREQAGAAAVPA